MVPQEPIAALTHLIGALVALALTPSLLRAAQGSALTRRVLSIFAAVVVFQLSVSGVYHWTPLETQARLVLQRADHAAIWLCVVGCFLPVRHHLLETPFGARLQVVVCVTALTGLLLETVFAQLIPSWVVVLLYVVFGSIGTPVAIWLVLKRGLRYTLPFFCCGVSFSIGALIELIEEPTLLPGWVGYHELVHLLVLSGFFCHWAFVHKLTREAAGALLEAPSAPVPVPAA